MTKTYHILTFGCQMNTSDSQRIESKLNDLGYKSASEQEAGLIIVNACSVRQHAVDRIWGKLKKWAALGQKKILVTGCILKEDASKFRVRNVICFKVTDLENLGNIIVGENKTAETDDLAYFHIQPKLTETSNAEIYIPIMTGCDNFCSYCAVPYTRGREVSRPMSDVTSEVASAVASGYKKIVLLGQNVNSYGNKTVIARSGGDAAIHDRLLRSARNDNIHFIELLKSIDNITGDFTFNFMSSNPHDMSDELIECYANLKKWPRQLHLAMQSGDDIILKKMNRKYTSEQFLSLISKLKNKIPNLPAGRQGIKISTDIIVGFPGETIEQFENTYKICQKIGFTQVFIGQYSPRPGTVSAKMPDDVTKEEKKSRFEKLDQLINH